MRLTRYCGQSVALSVLERKWRKYGSCMAIAQTIVCQVLERGVCITPPISTGSPKAHIIDQNPDYVRRARRRFHGFRPPFFRLCERSANDPLIRLCLLSMPVRVWPTARTNVDVNALKMRFSFIEIS